MDAPGLPTRGIPVPKIDLKQGASGSYHGNFLDPTDKTPQVIRYEHARSVVNNGGSVLLLGSLYHKDNFGAFPKELGFAQLSEGGAEAARADIDRRMKELEDERRNLDEAQAISKDQPADRPGRIADLLKHFRKTTLNVKGSDEFESWRSGGSSGESEPSGPTKTSGSRKESGTKDQK